MENVKEETKAALNQVAAEARERGYDSSLSLSDYSGQWALMHDIQRQVLEARIGSMTLVLSAPVALPSDPDWSWEIYYDSHQIHYGWGASRQEAEARAIGRAREWVAQTTRSLAAITQTLKKLEGLEPGEPGDPCPNDCGERLLAGSPAGNGRVACDKCQTFWD